ncbi:putative uncharacterized protein DDB_G0268364 [Musca vetustissima]|uniref:putative uncharacterized protein DDB_G0268364 n=1 Tax=Musca vetustissima TaxID=27455 RepID=UPI002AB61D64|nr:putative uncharacterized protein DDB_G0268364 [Musca vetustissima]
MTFKCCLLVLLLTEYGHAANKSSNTKDTKATSTATVAASTTTTPTTSPIPASAKSNDKLSYPKKVNTSKKRPSKSTSLKKVADITDKFKDLPADDLAFIKELDKQFKQHGGKVKIKVENDNATTVSTSKNSKRTIEGELGYGYAQNGYDYSPPKFEFYPYSQKDIPSDAPKYFLPNGKTEVTVEPSFSYELKPQTYVQHNGGNAQVDLPHPGEEQVLNEPQQHHIPEQPHQQQQYEEPVIVLRIPGPAKYASHLQTLLQQYLEIRAAQYLRILEEAEQQRQHQQHHQQHEQHQQQQLQEIDYAQHAGHVEDVPTPAPVEYNQEYQQHHQQQQLQYEPQPQYPAIDDVYQTYKYKHPNHPEQAQQPESPVQSYYQAPEPQKQQHYAPQPEQPQYYYAHQQEYAQPEGPPAMYQHVFLISMTPQAVNDYEHQQQLQQPQQQHEEPSQPIYVPAQPVADLGDHHALPITENNPRPSHTKVIFTHNPEHAGTDYNNMYPLPSIKPNERHAPHSVPDYHQDHQQQLQAYHQQQQESQESLQHYQHHQQQQVQVPQKQAQEQPQQVVAITQRPFNYHAHGTKPRARGRTNYKRKASGTADTTKADQVLEKINDYVREKFGAETGSASEYRTTQVISKK